MSKKYLIVGRWDKNKYTSFVELEACDECVSYVVVPLNDKNKAMFLALNTHVVKDEHFTSYVCNLYKGLKGVKPYNIGKPQ